MPIRPFKNIPRNLVEWSRFFDQTAVTPSDDSVNTDVIQDSSVTYAKIQNVATDRLLGRDTSPAGVVQEIAVGGGLEFTGTGGIQRSALSGDISAPAGSASTTLRNSAALSVIGRAANSTGTPADIAAAVAETFLVRRGTALTWDTLAESDIPASIARDAEVTSAISALNLASGTYTPTLTNVANIDASTAFVCQYLRVGSVVTVSGAVAVDPTAGAASTQLGISLPIASNFANGEDCGGTAFALSVQQGGGIFADAANDRAELRFLANDTANRQFQFTFTYRII